MSKNCNFEDKNREVKSQIIQNCLMHKIRDKGLSEVNITLPQLLTYGRTLEATVQQAKIMSNAAYNDTVHAVSHVAQSFSSKQGVLAHRISALLEAGGVIFFRCTHLVRDNFMSIFN